VRGVIVARTISGKLKYAASALAKVSPFCKAGPRTVSQKHAGPMTTVVNGTITDPAGGLLSGSCSIQAVGPFSAATGWRVAARKQSAHIRGDRAIGSCRPIPRRWISALSRSPRLRPVSLNPVTILALVSRWQQRNKPCVRSSTKFRMTLLSRTFNITCEREDRARSNGSPSCLGCRYVIRS